ncbi:MAG: NusG domain II-containing protein [Lachnospiraceae bacterium]|nr:NusG domain II-containing protein [Lachnospiraceae bacterium]
MDPERKRKLKNDVLLIGGLLTVSLAVFFMFRVFQRPGAYVEIRSGNEIVTVLPLSRNETRVVNSTLGTNTVVITDGSVSVTEADCRDHICIKRGPVKNVGETIVCLPHKLVLTIRAEE